MLTASGDAAPAAFAGFAPLVCFVLLGAVVLVLAVAIILPLRVDRAASSVTATTDGRPMISAAEQAQETRDGEKKLDALQEFVIDPLGSTENPETAQELLPALGKEVTQPPRASERQPNGNSDFAVQQSDGTAIAGNTDRLDMLGFMMGGKSYFANRAGAWEQFTKRHPDYQSLTQSTLAQTEQADALNKALQAAAAERDFLVHVCATEPFDQQADCLNLANKKYNLAKTDAEGAFGKP